MSTWQSAWYHHAQQNSTFPALDRMVYVLKVRNCFLIRIRISSNDSWWRHEWKHIPHICVGKLTIIGSGNGLSPDRRQAIIWTNAGILLIEPLGTNFSESLIGIQIFSFTKMRMKMSSVKWRPFCLGLNVLTHYFRWLNAKETNPQCTEAASLVSFALSHPFVICHQLNITLYCASITTAHAFPFRVASMPWSDMT